MTLEEESVLRKSIDNIFTYHAPTDEQREWYHAIRAKAKELAFVILTNTPSCADQTAAMRKLRECVMTANASIALNTVPKEEK